MKITELNLYDSTRSRAIPVLIYSSDNIKKNSKIVMFSPGYQEQKTLAEPDVVLGYKKWNYLAEYFVKKGYNFIAVQHDMLGDNDGLENLDPKADQTKARNHLWIRGEQNLLFVIEELKKQYSYSYFDFDKFIISGHSNGGDISRFFTNKREDQISAVISFDGRRCPIAPFTKQRLLLFEAWDGSTAHCVFPDEGTEDKPKRIDLEWMLVKPKDAMHISYRDDKITDKLKAYVLKTIEFFLDE